MCLMMQDAAAAAALDDMAKAVRVPLAEWTEAIMQLSRSLQPVAQAVRDYAEVHAPAAATAEAARLAHEQTVTAQVNQVACKRNHC